MSLLPPLTALLRTIATIPPRDIQYRHLLADTTLAQLKAELKQTIQKIPVPIDETIDAILNQQDTGHITPKPKKQGKCQEAWRVDNFRETDHEPHPYLAPISYQPFQMSRPDKINMFTPVEETDLIYVDTLEALQRMRETLNTQDLFGFDLEHHGERSYEGFTCLMQISTRSADYVIDTILLREHIHILKEPFENFKIVKIAHGTHSDINWLQRDFGIYVVNLFDTFFVARVLDMPQKSLQYILKTYCRISVDKQYQQADWRIRPLPIEYIHYAREDTHYLPYLFDVLRTELLNKSDENPEEENLLVKVMRYSEDLSHKKYSFAAYEPRYSWAKSAVRLQPNLNNQKFKALRLIHQLRDRTAREMDESPGYILSEAQLGTLILAFPTTLTQVRHVFHSTPPLVARFAEEIAEMFRLAENEKGSKKAYVISINEAFRAFKAKSIVTDFDGERLAGNAEDDPSSQVESTSIIPQKRRLPEQEVTMMNMKLEGASLSREKKVASKELIKPKSEIFGNLLKRTRTTQSYNINIGLPRNKYEVVMAVNSTKPVVTIKKAKESNVAPAAAYIDLSRSIKKEIRQEGEVTDGVATEKIANRPIVEVVAVKVEHIPETEVIQSDEVMNLGALAKAEKSSKKANKGKSILRAIKSVKSLPSLNEREKKQSEDTIMLMSESSGSDGEGDSEDDNSHMKRLQDPSTFESLDYDAKLHGMKHPTQHAVQGKKRKTADGGNKLSKNENLHQKKKGRDGKKPFDLFSSVVIEPKLNKKDKSFKVNPKGGNKAQSFSY